MDEAELAVLREEICQDPRCAHERKFHDPCSKCRCGGFRTVPPASDPLTIEEPS